MEQQIGKYAIDRVIGRGGMGVVYAAHSIEETDLNPITGAVEEVALKTLTLHSSEPEERAQEIQRFDKEITALRMIDHPNVVHILGFGVDEEQIQSAASQTLIQRIDACHIVDIQCFDANASQAGERLGALRITDRGDYLPAFGL